LYGEFAEVFALDECKLAIIHCAGHEDTALVDALWHSIISKGMCLSVCLSVCLYMCVSVWVCVRNCVKQVYCHVGETFVCIFAEARVSAVDGDSTPRSLKSKLLTLGQAHFPSEKYFPLFRIVRLLEQFGCQNKWNIRFVYRTMREIGVSFVDLLPLYDHLFKAKVIIHNMYRIA